MPENQMKALSPMLGILSAIGCMLVEGGCTASVSAGPGLQERRTQALKSYVESLYVSRSAEELSGVERVTYYACHGVTSNRIPFFEPLIVSEPLTCETGKAPGSMCLVVGWRGLGSSRTACICEAVNVQDSGTLFNNYIVRWDCERNAWDTLQAITQFPRLE
jgi:hypothetical protein